MRRSMPGAPVFRSGAALKSTIYFEQPYKPPVDVDYGSSSDSDSDLEDKRPLKKKYVESPSSATRHVSETPNLNTMLAGHTPAASKFDLGSFGADTTQESVSFGDATPTAPIVAPTNVKSMPMASLLDDDIMSMLENYEDDIEQSMQDITNSNPIIQNVSSKHDPTSPLHSPVTLYPRPIDVAVSAPHSPASVSSDTTARTLPFQAPLRYTEPPPPLQPTTPSRSYVPAPIQQQQTPKRPPILEESFMATQDPTQADNTRRRIPGPAGRLPPLKNLKDLQELVREGLNTEQMLRPTQAPSNGANRQSSHSQRQEDQTDFRHGAWMGMLCDMDLAPYGTKVLHTSLASINKDGWKAPVPTLIVYVKSFRLIEEDYRAILRDPTGAMDNCVISRSVADKFPDFSLGCVLQLQNVSVFTPMRGKHSLSILPDNIARIWPRIDLPRSELVSLSARIYDYKSIYDPSHFPSSTTVNKPTTANNGPTPLESLPQALLLNPTVPSTTMYQSTSTTAANGTMASFRKRT